MQDAQGEEQGRHDWVELSANLPIGQVVTHVLLSNNKSEGHIVQFLADPAQLRQGVSHASQTPVLLKYEG